MKNLLKSAVVLFAISSLFQSCSSSEETETPVTNQISVDGQPYNILPSNSVVELKMNNLNINGQIYDRSSISIIGMSVSIYTIKMVCQWQELIILTKP